MRPGTAHVDVKNVAIFFSRKLGVRISGDEVAELTVLATELAIFVGMLVNFCLRMASDWAFGKRGELTDLFWHFDR